MNKFKFITIGSWFNRIVSAISNNIYNFISYETNKLILFITGVFILQLFAPDIGLNEDIFSYSFEVFDPLSAVLAVFSHNGPTHFVTNISFLYIIGHTIENHMTKIKYYGLFIGGGVFVNIFAKILILTFSPDAISSVIGASGAISVFLGVSVLLYYDPEYWGETSPFTMICKPIYIISDHFDTRFNYGIIAYQLTVMIFSGVLLYVFTIYTLQANIFNALGGVVHFAHFLGMIVGLSYQSVAIIKKKI